MLGWQELSQQIQQITKAIFRFVKARRREEAVIGLAAILVWIGYSFPKWLTPELKDWIGSWHGLLIIPGALYTAGLVLLLYGLYCIWQLVHTPDLPPPKNRPSAIKGPLAFTPADGELFRKLGREDELRKLLGYIQDDQVRLVVLMGASGAGKTSLLRAGLTDILKDTGIKYHYWEAVPPESGRGLLTAIQQSWESKLDDDGRYGVNQTAPELQSLDELVNPAPEFGRHVVVLDQFEQLGAAANGPIFRLLRKVIREAKPPHRVTWVIAFRREFRANWSDFIIPEHERGFFPPELSLRLFASEQARDVVSQLIQAAGLSVEQKVINNLIEAATVEGEVSSVDIGIGLLVLAEMHERQGAKTLTHDIYHFAGGAEGLLTQYINRCLDNFPDEDRKALLSALLALRDAETNQRIAEGKTCDEIAADIEEKNVRRLKNQLERLTQRDIRLLEHVAASNDDAIRYRLPHERLIPALNRLAGRLIGELEEAKGKLENVFSTWRRNNASRYLLRGRDLRLVERYRNQIPWGKDEAEKLRFLKRSQRRRTLRRLISTALIIPLIASGWFVNTQYQRYDAQNYLRDNSYPAGLYDWHQQLKSLEIDDSSVVVKPHSWMRSNTIEEFIMFLSGNEDSLNGLVDNLLGCPALRKLELNLNNSKVSNLEPLSKLTNLTHLKLSLSYSNVSGLEPLSALTNLTHLDINLSDSNISSLEPLSGLTNLTQFKLELDIDESKIASLESLSKLTHLTELRLDPGKSEIASLESLSKLTNLTQLTLVFGLRSEIHSLEPLSKLELNPLTKFTLYLGQSDVSDLTPLSKLTYLTQLELGLGNSDVSDLTPLSSLTNLTQLKLGLQGLSSNVRTLESLSSLTNLTQLGLDLSDSNLSSLEPLSKLTNLTQLELELGRSGGTLNSLEPLSKLTNLTQLKLDLGGGVILGRTAQNRTIIRRSKVSNLEPLSKLSNLTQLELGLSGSDISSLEPLSKLTNLTQLGINLSDSLMNSLASLSKLANLTQFKLSLNLDESEVNDLTPLSSLRNLTQLNLNLDDSMISSLEPLSKLTNLTQLELYLGMHSRNSEESINSLEPLSKLTNLMKLELRPGISKVNNLEPLSRLNCQTLVLDLFDGERVALKAIPKSVTHLKL